MPKTPPRTVGALSLAVLATMAMPKESSATTYTWAGPFSGTGSSNPWSNPASWVGNQIPVSSTTTQLVFTNYDQNTYTATNDLLPSPFSLNNLSIQNWSQGGTVTISNLNASGGISQLQMTGASPAFNLSGPAGVTIGTLSSGTGYGLLLNPASGTTSVNDAGNGLVSFGSLNSGIGGTGGLTINDTGLATIQIFSPSSGNVNSYTGGVNLISGSLSINSSFSLGASANVLTINGGNLRGGSATFANPINAATDAVIFSGSPTIQGIISGNGGLHLYNGVAFSSANVTLSATETYTGPTTIDSGPLRTSALNLGFLTLSPTGSLQNTSAVNVGQSGTLTFTAGATNSAIPSGAPLGLSGAILSVLGNTNTTDEHFGNVSATGLTTLSYTAASAVATNTLNFGTFTQNDHATLFLRGNWQGTATTSSTVGVANFSSGITTVADANAPAGYSPVVPNAVGNLTSATSSAFNAFVSNGTSGLNLISITGSGVTQYSSLASGFSSLPANDVYLNLNTATTATLSGNAQVYALASSTGISTVTVGGTGTLNISSGVIVANGTLKLNGPTINFGTNTGYIHASYTGSSLTVYDTASPITGSNGVVISGPAGTAVTETVQFTDTGTSTDSSNPFTGGLTLNGGVNLGYTNDLQLGAAGQGITLNGGVLDYNPSGTSTMTLARPLRLGPAGGGAFAINTNTMLINSLISGPGAFYLSTGAANTGTTVLANSANSYSGGTFLYNGTLSIAADGDLGAAGTPVVLAGGTLQFAGPTTLNRPMPIWAVGSSINTNGFSSSIAGAFSSVSSTGGFSVTGGGTLNLIGANPLLSGSLTVSNAMLSLSGNGTLPQVPNVTVSTGGTFQFNNSDVDFRNRYSSLGRVSLTGGTLDLLGNNAIASTQTIGGINLPGTVGVSNSTLSVEPATATLTASGVVAGSSAYAQVIASATSPISTYTATSVTASPQSLTKVGPGTLVLSGANTFAGGVIVSAGTVKTANSNALGFGAVVPPTLSSEATIGRTAVSAGASLDLSGTAVTEPVTLNGGGLINSSSTAALLTSGIKGVSFNSTATSVNYAGVAGQTIGTSGSGYVPGDTITYTGGSGGSASLILGLTSASFNVTYGGNYTQAASGPTISINSSNGVGSGATAVPVTDANNDITGIDITNPGSGYTAAPLITILATGTYTPAVITGTTTGFGVVAIQQTAAGSGYSSAATSSVNSANGTGLQLNAPVLSSLTLQSNSSIGGTGNITVAPSITGSGGLEKVGPGTVILSVSNSYNGVTLIDSGLLVASQGTASLGTASTITINGGNLLLNNTSAATVFGLLRSGYAQGSWSGSTGINSVAASNDVNHLHAVGMLQPAANTTFEGQPLSPSDVAVKYTYYGDADLSGSVDGSDYSRIDNAYVFNSTHPSSPLSGWSNGDFNYDGVIDGSDYTLIDNAFNSQGASLAAQVATQPAFAASQVGGSASAVPEPTVLSLLGLGGVGLLCRRPRRRVGASSGSLPNNAR